MGKVTNILEYEDRRKKKVFRPGHMGKLIDRSLYFSELQAKNNPDPKEDE